MLTELVCKNFEPQEKSYKKFNGGACFLLVNPNGNKCWHLKYKYCKKTETGVSLSSREFRSPASIIMSVYLLRSCTTSVFTAFSYFWILATRPLYQRFASPPS